MNKLEKIIHFTVPEKLTPVQAQCIECARTLHPTWEVKVWQDPVRPDGYLLEKYWSKVNSGAQLGDLLRLDVLYKWGGVYVDSDMRLIKPLDDLVARFEFFVASETGTTLEGALIGARKAHPGLKTLIDELLSNEPDWTLPPDKTTGPDFFARTLRWNDSVTVLPRETFYSYPPWARAKANHRHSYGEHLWAYSWKHLNRPFDIGFLKSGSDRVMEAVKRVVKSTVVTGFDVWHRIKRLDLAQANFFATGGELVVQTAHGFKIAAEGKDTSLTPELAFGSYHDPREERFCNRIFRGGDWMIDVGSKPGIFCMLAAQRVGSFGRVFAYEANPTAMRLLSKSAVMNWMHDRVVMRPVVVGDFVGKVTRTFVPERLGDTSAGPDEIINSILRKTARTIGSDKSNATDYVSVTLDTDFPIDLPIKLLKIDAEGEEVGILKGARRLLEHRCIDFVMIRIFRDAAGSSWRSKLERSQWGELITQLNFLIGSNYVVCTLEKDGTVVAQASVTSALDNLKGRSIVLMARDQYPST